MKYSRPRFDLASEILNLRSYTKLPITNIIFLNPAQEFEMTEANDHRPKETAELYVKDTAIGNMEYYIFPNIIGCDTSTQDNLDWNKIYRLCEPDILPLIQALEPLTHNVRPIKYRRVAVYDIDNAELTHVSCCYENNRWVVSLMGLNYSEKVLTVQVKLIPPPPKTI